MKENVIKLYKKWAKPYVKYYGDFDSAEECGKNLAEVNILEKRCKWE